MDRAFLLTVVGTVIGIGGLTVSALQLRLARQVSRPRPSEVGRLVPGASVSAPTGLLPADVLGRDDTMAALQRRVAKPKRFVVLVGMGGVGKSTVAIELARRLRDQRRLWGRPAIVWWVSASDQKSLSMGAVSIIKQAGGGEAAVEAVATGSPDGPDLLWKLLERTEFRWLLVYDNADDPTVLHVPQSLNRPDIGGVAAGNGWVRASSRGLAVVTSRHADPATWGRHAEIMPVEPLDTDTAVKVLTRLAPHAGDGLSARQLAEHLGGLPLALHVAGAYLGYPLARWTTFADYAVALNDRRSGAALALADQSDDARGMVMRTWELSLDNLADQGLPQARPVLRMLSCYAAATPIPVDLIDHRLLGPLFEGVDDVEGHLGRVIRGLIRLGLANAGNAALVIHPVIADACQAHLARPDPGDPDPDIVRTAAVDLAAAKCEALDFSSPADWPWFARLTPHLDALLALPLRPGPLGRLCRAAAKTSLAYDWSGGLNTAIALTDAALAASAPLGEEHPSVLRLRQQQILQLGRRGHWIEAEPQFDALVAVQRRVLGDDHPVTLSTMHDLGRSYAHQGRWAEAEAMALDVSTRRGAVFGWDHPATLASRHHLARAYAAQHRWDEADATFEQLVAAERAVLGEEHPTTLATRAAQARSLDEQERWQDAEAAYRKLLDGRRRVLGEDHPSTITSLAYLARGIEKQGRTQEATQIYRDVLAARLRVLGEAHPETVEARETVGRLA